MDRASLFSVRTPLSLCGLAGLAASMPVAAAGWPGRLGGLLVCTGRFDEAGAGLAQPVVGLQACTCSSSPFRLATRFVLWPKVSHHSMRQVCVSPRRRYRTHSAVEVITHLLTGHYENPCTITRCGRRFEAPAKDSLDKCVPCGAHPGPPQLKNLRPNAITIPSTL